MNIQPFLGRLPMPENGFPIEIREIVWEPTKCYFADLVRKCPGVSTEPDPYQTKHRHILIQNIFRNLFPGKNLVCNGKLVFEV